MKQFDRKEMRKIKRIVDQKPRKKIYGDSRDSLLAEGKGVPCTMPPRQRAGKTYAGGRRLRRAMARLASAQKGINDCRANASKAGKKSVPANAFKTPGAMRP